MLKQSLRKNWLFWACIVAMVALVPIMVLVPDPFTVWVALADFLVAVALLCIWLERQEAKVPEPPRLVFVKEADLEKLRKQQTRDEQKQSAAE